MKNMKFPMRSARSGFIYWLSAKKGLSLKGRGKFLGGCCISSLVK
jgi:hypothetical protein